MQSLVHGQRLRFRHVDAALGRVGVEVVDVEQECPHWRADSWVGFQVLIWGWVGGSEREGGDGEEEGDGGDLHGGQVLVAIGVGVGVCFGFWLFEKMAESDTF